MSTSQWVAVVWGEEIQDAPDVFGPFSTREEAEERLSTYRAGADEDTLADAGIHMDVVPIDD